MRKLFIILLSILLLSGATFGGIYFLKKIDSENITKLATPKVALTNEGATWKKVSSAQKYEIDINGVVSYVDKTTFSTMLKNGDTFKIRSISDGTNYLDSDWSKDITYIHDHKFDEVKYVWNEDNTQVTASHVCIYSSKHVETETVNTIATVTQEATCEKDELLKLEAKFINSSFKPQIKNNIKTKEKFGHSYGDVEYVWSKDNLKVTAMRTCIHDKSHIESETVYTNVEIIQNPNELGIGINKYTTNKFNNDLYQVQTKESEINYDDYFVFTLINDTYTLAKFKNNLSTVVIPSEYKGKKVTSIGNQAFENCSRLISITIPKSITSIGDDAFYGCYKLFEIYNLSNLDIKIGSWNYGYIGSYAKVIHKDINETSIIITKDGYQFIKDDNDIYYLFNYIGSNTNLELPDNINNGNYQINDYAFYRNTSLTSVIIPNSVTSIGGAAFYNCSSLTSITILQGVTSIGSCAFEGCSSLTSITIPQGVTSIGSSAFEDCSRLISITIPDGVTSIGDFAFWGCSNLTSITIPQGVTSIGGRAFSYCSSLTSITIPQGVTSIGGRAFSYCSSLTSIKIHNSVTSIGEDAFKGCIKLVEIYNLSNLDIKIGSWNYGYIGSYAKVIHKDINEPSIIITTKDGYQFIKDDNGIYYLINYICSDTILTLPDNINNGNYQINDYAFYRNTSLTSITIPESVTSIGDYAFYNCSSLTNITIPQGVISIGDRAFYECSSLTNITIPNSVTSIGWSAFSGCFKLVEIYNLSNLDIYSGFTKVIHKDINEPSRKITTKDGYQFIKDDNDIYYLFNYIGNDTNLILPNNINGSTYQINDYAFYECSSLTSVTIPESVTSIGDYALCGCSSLTNITIPNSVTSIGKYAFEGCSSLTSITIPESVTSIGSFAFSYCNKLTNVTIPKSVTSIGDYAFNKCSSLTSITIPESVTSIGEYAFSECFSLTSITIPNSVTSIGWWAFRDCSSLTIYCEAKTEPSTWSNKWNDSNCPVVWNYKKR